MKSIYRKIRGTWRFTETIIKKKKKKGENAMNIEQES